MGKARRRRLVAFGSLGALALLANSQAALADAGGVGFWFPGAFGSLAAAPGVPGWAYTTIYVHEQERAGGGKNFVVSGRPVGSVVAGLTCRCCRGSFYLYLRNASARRPGRLHRRGRTGNVNASISATLTGPLGNTISGSASDNRTTLADLIYQGTLKWNQGVHNEMVYFSGNIPSGTYDPNRLANMSLGFVAYVVGAGYTYLDPKTGHEFSVVRGAFDSKLNPSIPHRSALRKKRNHSGNRLPSMRAVFQARRASKESVERYNSGRSSIPIMSCPLSSYSQRERLTFARSISWVARPSRTAFIMYIPK
jgi:Putative MetA-pathway of phenol degradation